MAYYGHFLGYLSGTDVQLDDYLLNFVDWWLDLDSFLFFAILELGDVNQLRGFLEGKSDSIHCFLNSSNDFLSLNDIGVQLWFKFITD